MTRAELVLAYELARNEDKTEFLEPICTAIRLLMHGDRVQAQRVWGALNEPQRGQNQCDGCAVAAPKTERGSHAMPDGGFMGCTADKYR